MHWRSLSFPGLPLMSELGQEHNRAEVKLAQNGGGFRVEVWNPSSNVMITAVPSNQGASLRLTRPLEPGTEERKQAGPSSSLP